VEGNVEDTNWTEGRIKVVWEILPGDGEYHFEEITQEDFDPNLFSSNYVPEANNFPFIPYAVLNPACDCLDRVWTQTVIKIDYQFSKRSDEFET
jgi:hypothetical protein